MGTGRITINIKVGEQDLVEGLLNLKHSKGIDDKYLTLILSLTALGKGWKFDKLAYYLNLLEIKSNY